MLIANSTNTPTLPSVFVGARTGFLVLQLRRAMFFNKEALGVYDQVANPSRVLKDGPPLKRFLERRVVCPDPPPTGLEDGFRDLSEMPAMISTFQLKLQGIIPGKCPYFRWDLEAGSELALHDDSALNLRPQMELLARDCFLAQSESYLDSVGTGVRQFPAYFWRTPLRLGRSRHEQKNNQTDYAFHVLRAPNP
ncbi:MAG: hypothetical protein LAN70_13590 [Acidobacteriia bacterium]|nr:hypothetical protein [Terriglobia bacterium]